MKCDFLMNMIRTKEFTDWLNGFIDYSRNKNKNIENLKKMQFFAEFFNNPQNNYKSIHIAGSKGKGSVSTMIASILSEAEFKTGLYTSPHVMDFRERISLAGAFFSDKEYSSAYEKIIAGFGNIISQKPDIDPGWFEIVTMTAFLIFKMQKCEWAVFETGLGGRLDMTNIITPKLCVLTPIELEHCAYLGDTIEKIASEKAGIIKKNTPVFCAKQCEEAFRVFKKKAEEMQADFFYLPEIIDRLDFKQNEFKLEVNIKFNKKNPVGKLFKRELNTQLKLIDSVQAENATLSAAAIKYLFPDLDEAIIEKALAKTDLPARFEILNNNPKIIVDGAHTKNSLEICIKTFLSITQNSKTNTAEKKGTLVFACADDKDSKSFVHLFEGIFRKIIITIPTEEKAGDMESVYNNFKNALTKSDKDSGEYSPTLIEKNKNYKEAITNAITESKRENTPLLITGSFYLAAAAKAVYKQLCK